MGRDHTSHSHRQDLAGEHRLGDTGQLAFGLLFLVVWCADSFLLGYTTWLNRYVPLAVRIVAGLVCLFLAARLSSRGMQIVFGEARPEPVVISQDVFGLVRHPIYLGEMLLYLGVFSFSLSLLAGAVMLAACLFLHYLARYEEKLLLAQFGQSYRDYMRRVPMWLPRLTGPPAHDHGAEG